MKITLNDLKPSHFVSRPMDSVLQNSESETIARNIMIIRKRSGDSWELTWDKYRDERMKDEGFSEAEESLFNRVYPMIDGPIGAIGFAPGWGMDAKRATRP